MAFQPIVRAYRPADAAALIPLAEEMAADLTDPPPPLDATVLARATAAAEPWCELLVAAEGERLLGFVVFTRRFEAHMGRFSLWIADLHVASSQRRRGVGKALMRAVAKRAREQQCGLVAWDLWAKNDRARSFYLALGAEIQDEMQLVTVDPARLLG